MSPKTIGPTSSELTAGAPTTGGLSRSNSPRRLAMAGLLTLIMMMPMSAHAQSEIEQCIEDARSQACSIEDDLGRVSNQLTALPQNLQSEVAGAVDSAHAAITEANTALTNTANSPDGWAAVNLADAQVALEAASAQVRYVTGLAADAGSPVWNDLRRVARHIDELRGEANRAAV